MSLVGLSLPVVRMGRSAKSHNLHLMTWAGHIPPNLGVGSSQLSALGSGIIDDAPITYSRLLYIQAIRIMVASVKNVIVVNRLMPIAIAHERKIPRFNFDSNQIACWRTYQ